MMQAVAALAAASAAAAAALVASATALASRASTSVRGARLVCRGASNVERRKTSAAGTQSPLCTNAKEGLASRESRTTTAATQGAHLERVYASQQLLPLLLQRADLQLQLRIHLALRAQQQGVEEAGRKVGTA